MSSNLENRAFNATKWSALTEIFAKLITPITNIILARIIAPEAFGVIAIITMIISFVEMFTDSGFQKYLIQHEFNNEKDKYKYAEVAFWTNLTISFVLWILIVIFRDQIATLTGNPELGLVIAISSFQLPLNSFTSIQIALYKRDLEFKALFFIRIISVCIPFFVTIPLAFLGLSYWAIILSSFISQILVIIILLKKSNWIPKFRFNIKILLKMYSFSFWSLVESLSIWISSWIDIFIIGYCFNQHYLGLYSTSINMFNSIMALITASTIPVFFSTLSRLQNDKLSFNRVYFKFQRIFSILVFPMGVGIYLYSDFIISLLLGEKWVEAGKILGIFALTSSIKMVLGDLSSEVYRAKGKPKLSFLAQILHLIVMIPTCLISVNFGFLALVFARSLIRLQFILVHFIITEFVIGIQIIKIIKNILPTAISTLIMGIFGYLLQRVNNELIWNITSIIACAVLYFLVLWLFPIIKKDIQSLKTKFFKIKV